MAGTKRDRLVLASASPRRVELLSHIGIEPDEIIPADIDETAHKGELPRMLALRLAAEKAAAVAGDRQGGAYVMAADTIVALGRRILGKPDDEAEARKHLELLSGRAHQVITGVCVISPEGRTSSRAVMTRVKFKRLTAGEIAAYLACGEWDGKAGSYGIQGRAGAFVTSLNGSYSAVVGLPLYETKAMLEGLGWRLPATS